MSLRSIKHIYSRKKAAVVMTAVFAVWVSIFYCISGAAAAQFDDLEKYLSASQPKTISMDFKNANLTDVLKVLSQQSGMNFIATTEISNRVVNVYLDKVPVEQALEQILSANGLTYELKAGSNIFIVKVLAKPAKEVITRVYHLKHATVVSSKLNNTIKFGDEGSSSSLGTTGTKENKETGIVSAIRALLTSDGSIVEDQRTNSLSVTDIPSQFPLIEQTIARLDVRIPQVLIEVEMLDISKDTADLMGAKFGDTPVSFTGAERDTLYPFNRNQALSNYGKSGGQGFNFSDPEYRVGTLSFAGLSIVLQFLRTQTDTRNLARPRILTLNNETAELAISTDEAIGISSVTTSSQGNSTAVAEAERVKTGVSLKVTPQVNVEDSEITMAIEPKVTEAKTGATFSGQTFKDPEVRETKSILRVKDGDTIVIGGLLRTDVQSINTRVPLLGDIPVLGSAFRHKDKQESQRELVIFITPHIVTDELTTTASSRNSPQVATDSNVPLGRTDIINKELSAMEIQRF